MPELWKDSLPRHQFSHRVVELFVNLVLEGPASLRGASKALEMVLSRLLGLAFPTPSAQAGRLWLLRIGLFELTRSKKKANDWVWIVDHTIQIGSKKCLVVLGCRLREWERDPRPLRHLDVEVLLLELVETSNGQTVYQQLERVAQQTGVPREIVSDGGADLVCGIRLFQAQHANVAHGLDITHKVALFLKKLLTNDPRWEAFLKKMAHCKKQFVKSPLAFLTPPLVPTQARFMNLEALMNWATKVRRFLDTPSVNDGSLADPILIEREFGWLREFDAALSEWNALINAVAVTLAFVRRNGYHRDSSMKLHIRLTPFRDHDQSRQLCDQIVEFVKEQSLQAEEGERLIGTSECLESLIGKGKRLEGQQSRSGFTVMVLGMAAAVFNPARTTIAQALAVTKTKDLRQWAHRMLGKSVQASRHAIYKAVPPPKARHLLPPPQFNTQIKQIQDNLQIIPTPSF